MEADMMDETMEGPAGSSMDDPMDDPAGSTMTVGGWAHYTTIDDAKMTAEKGPTVLLSDHMSNFLDVRGQIPEDREVMLETIDDALDWPAERFRPPTERLVGLTL